MAITEEVRLLIKAEVAKATKDLKGFNDQLGNTSKVAKKQSSTLGSLKTSWLAYGIALRKVGQFVGSSIKAASDLTEEQGKFNVVFGDTAKTMEIGKQAIDDLTTSYNMSHREAFQLTSRMQDLLKPMGFMPEKAAAMSSSIIKLAADMGSFNNVPTEQALEAIRSSLIGMNRPMRQFGTVIREDTEEYRSLVKQMMISEGITKTQAKTQVNLNKIFETQTDAIGDVARTQDNFANQLKRTEANLEDFQAGIGEDMIAALSVFQSGINSLGISFKDLGQGVTRAVLGFVGFNSLFAAMDIKKLVNAKDAEKLKEFMRDWKKGVKSSRKAIQKLKRSNKSAWKSIVSTQKSALEQLTVNTGTKFDQQRKKVQDTYDAALRGRRLSVRQQEDIMIGFQQRMNKIAEDETKFKKDQLEKQFQDRLSNANKVISNVSSVHNAIGGVLDAFNTMRSQQLENQQLEEKELFTLAQEEKQLKLDEDFERERLRIESTITNEAQKAAALKKLEDDKAANDKKLDKEKLAFEKKQEKERRKLAREQAIINKAVSLTSAGMNTATGITGALAQTATLGYGALILAGIIGALGAAQVGLIAATPLPKLADGGIIPGSAGGTQLIAGENNASEAIIPLENDNVPGLGSTVNVYIENAFGSDDLSSQFKNAIDMAMFELDQDGNSLFAERVRNG